MMTMVNISLEIWILKPIDAIRTHWIQFTLYMIIINDALVPLTYLLCDTHFMHEKLASFEFEHLLLV